METWEKSTAKHIVPASSQELAVRSAAIVTRGLRDLARESNWLIKKVFNGRSSHVVISPGGQLCAVSPLGRKGEERIVLYDVELCVPTLRLAIPSEPAVIPPGLPAVFAWSPTARHLVAAWGGWGPELQIFDLQGKALLGGFGEFTNFPSSLSWSGRGNYFVAASRGGQKAQLRLWHAAPEGSAGIPFSADPEFEFGAPGPSGDWLALESDDADSDDECVFSGFGRTDFSPNETRLASVVEIEGEWADDLIVVLELLTLRRQNIVQAQGHVTGLAWTFDSSQLIYCSAGQAYRLVATGTEPESLPFGAELCACHPYLPLCLCFSSWLKNSAKGRLFLVDLRRLDVFDEYAAEGVVDLRWSLDGSKAYAVTADGLAYLYEPPLL